MTAACPRRGPPQDRTDWGCDWRKGKVRPVPSKTSSAFNRCALLSVRVLCVATPLGRCAQFLKEERNVGPWQLHLLRSTARTELGDLG
jgi:hypothetical protein